MKSLRLTSMNEIAKLQMPKLNKAPKHKLSMLRNMACSLIKYERVESTDGKARCLALYMKRIFDVIYDSTIPEHIKHSKLQSMIPHIGALTKLKENLLNKLKNSRNKEILIYFNRIKANNNHKMLYVEFDKNDKKRAEDKKFFYFTKKINNPFYDFEFSKKQRRLSELYSFHMLFSNLIKKNYLDLVPLFSSKKPVIKSQIFEITKKNYNLIPDDLKNDDVKNMLFNELTKCIKCPNSALEYLMIFRRQLSLLNAEINSLKVSLSELDKIKLDDKALYEYNKRFYNYYYKEEYRNYDIEYQKSREILTESKEPLRNMLKAIKNKEAKIKKAVLVYDKTTTNDPSETELSMAARIKLPGRKVKEYKGTYSKYYVTGDESGFSDLEDIKNKPRSIVSLRNALNKEMVLKTNGRSVKREYNKLV